MSHKLLSDIEFLESLEDCSLDPVTFSHEAHLRLAWLKLNDPNSEPLVAVPRLIQNYTAHLGAQDKYNHTVTIAAVMAVSHFINKLPCTTFEEFIEQHQELLTDFKGLLSTHYSMDIFKSEEAKKIFLEPDLCPFHFH